jgi:hypothetical protein
VVAACHAECFSDFAPVPVSGGQKAYIFSLLWRAALDRHLPMMMAMVKAKLFMAAGSQTVRLAAGFVGMRRHRLDHRRGVGGGVLSKPIGRSTGSERRMFPTRKP